MQSKKQKKIALMHFLFCTLKWLIYWKFCRFYILSIKKNV